MRSFMVRPWYTDPTIVERSRQVARVLTLYGLDTLVHETGLGRFARLTRRARHRPRPAEGLRQALGELGTTFIKLGQMLSTRADLLPAEFIAELAKLQDAAPPVAIEAIVNTIAEDLGAAPEQLFATFDPTPLASASMARYTPRPFTTGVRSC